MSFPDILDGQAVIKSPEEGQKSVQNIGKTQVAFVFAVLLFMSWIKQQDLAVVIYLKSIYSYLHSESDARSKL